MARVLGNPFGELRGKAGGSVFSRNRAGQFMRVYGKPAQANSDAQTSSRATFGMASQSYSALTTLSRSTYENFALNVYNPLRKTNIGQYTGQQAYIAQKQSVEQSIIQTILCDFEPLGGGTPHPYTDLGFSVGVTAPVQTVQPTVPPATGGVPLPLSFNVNSLTSIGVMDFDILFGLTGMGIAAGDLRDFNGKPFAIGFYLSDPLKNANSRPKNKWFQFAGNTPVPNFTTNLPAGTLGLSVPLFQINLTRFKSFLAVDNFVQVTCVQIGNDGTQATVGSQYVQVT